MGRINRVLGAIFSSSILWGGLAAFGFFGLIHTGTLADPFFKRYFAGHWVEYIETTMFFVGVAALLLKAFDVAEQRSKLKLALLGERSSDPLPVSAAPELLESLNQKPAGERHGYLPRRLREALDSIVRKGTANDLEEELKYLSDVDAGRAHASYALLRILIWAIPILGFLGTVIGITLAIASLNPEALENSLGEVTGGLGVAFDTTALALSLSMALMFGQFFVDRMEGRLLGAVDTRAQDLLSGRFATVVPSNERSEAVDRITEEVLRGVGLLVERQAEVWRGTIDSAHERWNELTASSGQILEQALSKSLTRSLLTHAEQLAATENEAAENNRRVWNRVHEALNESSLIAQRQQSELVRQGQVMVQLVEATGQVAKLEDTLNHNLASLAGSQHLQDTLLNLSAAIHLLNARLNHVTPLAPTIEFKDTRTSHAA